MSISKPKFGSPCNGCGLCCSIQPCLLAAEVINCKEGPCKALEHNNGKYECGLVNRPAFYMFGEDAPKDQQKFVSDIFAEALGVGKGCDSEDFFS